MPVSFKHRGSFEKLELFLDRMLNFDIHRAVAPFAQDGVDALSAATPRDTGLAASEWGYVIQTRGDRVKITWVNMNVESGFKVAIQLQYGYATGTGGFVAGQDYINPAMKPIFDRIAEGVWKAVTSA
jgi:hypothetical protein